jgi:monoamine oxidase
MFKILLIILINLINYLIKANDENVYDVIIVGGGVSGLSTASRLIKNGIDNILLIEADSRLGGRAHTINYSIYYYSQIYNLYI